MTDSERMDAMTGQVCAALEDCARTTSGFLQALEELQKSLEVAQRTFGTAFLAAFLADEDDR